MNFTLFRSCWEVRNETDDDQVKLGWKDYLAFIIAAFETILVPILVFVVVLLALLFFLHR